MTPSHRSYIDEQAERWRKIDRNLRWATRLAVVSVVCVTISLGIWVLRAAGVI